MTDRPTLEWINARPEGADAAVIEDISKSLADLKSPEYLNYHTVFLGDDMVSAPGVIVTGETGNPNFVCEYFPVIGDAFETVRPNENDADIEALLAKHGISELTDADLFVVDVLRSLPREELDAMVASLEATEGSSDPEAALKVFLRGRGGKATRSDEDHPLGHNAIANRIAENEQDKGA